MRLSNRQGGKSGLRQRTDLARGRNTAAFKANIKSLLQSIREITSLFAEPSEQSLGTT
jgi:hypothetical protein